MDLMLFFSKPLQLFGTTLRRASRADLRQVFRRGGLRATREEDQYWVDMYDANGVLEGATEFQAGYVMSTGRFAYARYTFPGHTNAKLLGDVIRLVQVKYGRPTSQEGHVDVGTVTLEWRMRGGMVIRVVRNWPDITVYLVFEDVEARAMMRVEMESEDDRQDRRKAKLQGDAF